MLNQKFDRIQIKISKLEVVVMERVNLAFEEIDTTSEFAYSFGCSGGRSDCCTRVCTRDMFNEEDLKEWDRYFEVDSGVVQY